jgi:hypothetical protein
MGIHNIVVENLEYHIPYTSRVMSAEDEARMLKAMEKFYSFTRATEENNEIVGKRREIQHKLNTKFYGLAK